MRTLWLILFYFLLITNLSACSGKDKTIFCFSSQKEKEEGGDDSNNKENMKLQITIGTTKFTATLQDNVAVKAFRELLPMTITMSDFDRNEKYYNLPNRLPTSITNTKTVHNGDIMLFGLRTFVIFYKTFPTSYSYTKIGSIDNPLELEKVLGAGSVTVRLEELRG